MQASQKGTLWTIIVCSALLLLMMLYGFSQVPEAQVIPSAENIASVVLAGIAIPTAEEIAAEVNLPEMPDTKLSVKETKKDIASELAYEQLSERDVKKAIVEAIGNECDNTDVEYKEITSIVVKDVDVDIHGEDAVVELEIKVYFENYGDESESARLNIVFDVTDLDRDEDYEEAEAELDSVTDTFSCSTE